MTGARRAAIARALASPLGAAPGALLHAPRVTALLAHARGIPALAEVVPPLLEVLDRAGTGRGRVHLLVAEAGGTPATDLRALRSALGIPVIGCDPARSTGWRAGVVGDGLACDLDDELREAEALIALDELRSGDPPAELGGRIVVPGFASEATRAALAEASSVALNACRALVPLDALLAWSERGDAAWFGTADAVQRAAGGGA